MNITTDKGDIFFDLTPLGLDDIVNKASIYTIWTRTSEPNKYTLIYIGESGQTETRLNSNHHKYQCWLDNDTKGLYKAFLWMPVSEYTKEQRFTIEADLIKKYNPACNN